MRTLIEKAERLIAKILEAMDNEQGNVDSSSAPFQDDESSRHFEPNAAAHHTLIELCW
jgi:hypothetical protein